MTEAEILGLDKLYRPPLLRPDGTCISSTSFLRGALKTQADSSGRLHPWCSLLKTQADSSGRLHPRGSLRSLLHLSGTTQDLSLGFYTFCFHTLPLPMELV